MSLEDETKKEFLKTLEKLSEDRDQPLDKVFTAWIAENIFGLDNEEDIDRCIEVGASGDWGIDFFHVNDDVSSDQYIAWGQAKFSKNFDYVLDRKDFEEFVNTINILEDPPKSSKRIIVDISEQFLNNRTRITQKRMCFFLCGKISEQVNELLNDPVWLAKNKDPDTNFEFYDESKLLALIKSPETPPLTLQFESKLIQKTDNITKKNSLIGYVKASEISRIYSDSKIRDTINNLNLREYVGRTKYNQGIVDTLLDTNLKSKFWKLNNGITATCEKFNDNTDNNNEFRFQNLKIVNGRQTSMTLYKKKDLLDDTVTVKLIVHETIDDEERRLISKCTNTQNAIKASDIITNKELIAKLEIQFRKLENWFFETQRGSYSMLDTKSKTKITKRRRLEKETMSRRYLAFNGDPYFAIRTRDEELLLVENNLKRVFENKSPEDFIFPHIFYQCLEELDSKWKNSSNEKDQKQWPYLHKRVVKFYVVALIKRSLEQLDASDKEKVLEKIFEDYNKLKNEEEIDQKYLNVVRAAFYEFLILYSEKNPHGLEEYDDEDMRKHLLSTNFFPILEEHKEKKMEVYPDAISEELKKIQD